MNNKPQTWICTYNSEQKLFTVLLAINEADDFPGWVTLLRDDTLSDSEGNFSVFVGTDVMWQMPDDLSIFPQVKVEIKADDSGNPLAVHKDFNYSLLGSPTLYGPPNLYGRDRNDFIWFTTQKTPLWIGE